MKKYHSLLLFTLVLLSCRKTERIYPAEDQIEDLEVKAGIPEHVKSHGYFFARYSIWDNGSRSITGMAAFTDQLSDFSSTELRYKNNINVGLGDVKLKSVRWDSAWYLDFDQRGLNVQYRLLSNLSPQDVIPNLEWTTEGVKNYEGITTKLEGGWPVLSSSAYTLSSLNKNADYVFYPPDFASNYDSIIIIAHVSHAFVRKASINTDSIRITKSELKTFGTGNETGFLKIMLFKYHHGIIKRRKYLFETSAMFEKIIYYY